MSTPTLDRIATEGNRSGRPEYRFGENWITCADGFRISVIAGWGAYCQPRPGDPAEWGGVAEDYPGPYTAVEAWPQGDAPGKWHEHAAARETTCVATISVAEDCTCSGPYGHVPVEWVRELIEAHGGER